MRSSKLPFGRLARSLAAACLALAVAWSASAQAQSCPSSYAACDNGGCCLASDQCCPSLAEGCCPPHAPYCCGDGSCAAAPSKCGNLPRNTCPDYEVPCGEGCAPAGSQCCDLAGHYCRPQGICSSETTCLAGDDTLPADQVIVVPPPAQQASTQRTSSPLLDPPAGTARSCALGLARGQGGAAAGALLLLALFAIRRMPTPRVLALRAARAAPPRRRPRAQRAAGGRGRGTA
jgi:hypothetical protein